MKGTILAQGVISANDGNRYTYDISEIKNLDGKDPNNLKTAQVDFEPSSDESGAKIAKEIYITKGKTLSFDVSAITDNTIGAIRLKMLIAMGLFILAWIPIVGFVFGIVGVFLTFIAISALSKKVGSKTLFKNYIVSLIISSFGAFVVVFTGMFVGIGTVIAVILGIILSIVWLIYTKNYYKELRQITGEAFFTYSFTCQIVGIICMLTIVGIIAAIPLFIIADVLLICAWWKVEKIQENQELIKAQNS